MRRGAMGLSFLREYGTQVKWLTVKDIYTLEVIVFWAFDLHIIFMPFIYLFIYYATLLIRNTEHLSPT
jgi:hypothetical protein